MTKRVPRLQKLPLQMPEDPMTPEMEAAAWEGLATNPAAQMAAEGNDTVARWLFERAQVAVGRERLHDLEQRADRNPGAGQLAFIVRDLMDAASYPYTSDRPLADQARECCDEISAGWEKCRELDRMLVVAVDRHAAEIQRRDDLVAELRRQVEGLTRREARS